MKIRLYTQEGGSFCHSILVEDDKVVDSWITQYARLPREAVEAMRREAAKWVGVSGAHGLLDEAGYRLDWSGDTRMDYEEWTQKRDRERW